MSDLCEGQTICWPDVTSSVFGDSCYGIYKYLEVELDCLLIQHYFAKSPGTTFYSIKVSIVDVYFKKLALEEVVSIEIEARHSARH